jgi:hypothetical protein
METNFDETLVAGLAAAEKQVQQSYRPVIAIHKWFARRPGTLFRGLALAELVDVPLADHYFEGHDLDGVVLDPFMGGGTSLFEANRLGLSVVGYDTNPMSRWLVERELEELDVEAFEREGEAIAAEVEQELRELYTTRCEECDSDVPVKFFMWVKTHVCDCGEETPLFPGPLVAGRKMGRHTHDVLVAAPAVPSRSCFPTSRLRIVLIAELLMRTPGCRRRVCACVVVCSRWVVRRAGIHPGMPCSRWSTTARCARRARGAGAASSREPTTRTMCGLPMRKRDSPARTRAFGPSMASLRAMRRTGCCGGDTEASVICTTSANCSDWPFSLSGYIKRP